jgi:hypothetical protein
VRRPEHGGQANCQRHVAPTVSGRRHRMTASLNWAMAPVPDLAKDLRSGSLSWPGGAESAPPKCLPAKVDKRPNPAVGVTHS